MYYKYNMWRLKINAPKIPLVVVRSKQNLAPMTHLKCLTAKIRANSLTKTLPKAPSAKVKIYE